MYVEDLKTLQNANQFLVSNPLQIFDLKQLADKEDDCRKKCMVAIDRYKKWKRQYCQQTDMIEILYGNIEGIMLRQQAESAVGLYWVLRRDFRNAWVSYRENSCRYPAVLRSAS